MASETTTVAKKRLFLLDYAKSGNVWQAAKHAGISRAIHYVWLEADAEYKRKVEDAKQDACDVIDAEIRKRATRKKAPSDTLLIFHAKKLMPEYRDNYRVDLAGAGGGPLEIQVRFVNPPEPDTTT